MKCPNCGAETKTNPCEYCDSTFQEEQPVIHVVNNYYGTPAPETSAPAPQPTAVPQKPAQTKKNTWLWVLGWIFMFPLPLTILLLRNKQMNPILKYGLIILAWLVYFGIGLSESDEITDPEIAAYISCML